MDIKEDPGATAPVDVIMEDGYPSAATEGGDPDPGSYYNTEQPRDQEIGDGQVVEGHHQQERPDEQEQTSPQPLESRPSVSAEELVLAAQLTRDLAPMMTAHSQSQEEQHHHLQQVQQAVQQAVQQVQEADMQGPSHEQPSYEEQQPQDTEYQPHSQQPEYQDQVQETEYQDHSQNGGADFQDQTQGTDYQSQAQSDANLHQQLHTQLQDHGLPRELQNAIHEQAQAQAQAQAQVQGQVQVQPHAHAQAQAQGDGQNDIQSQSQTPDPAHYAPPPPMSAHLQHGMPLNELAQQYQSMQAMQDSSIPPRKRSKVSRACDECRRKKIKCDALSENGEEPCSNCRRSNAKCLFSRVPQKRGPSKGYIKELADRINSIEGKLGGGADLLDSASRRVSTEAFSSPLPIDDSRKRQFASISTESFTTPTAPRQAAWPTEHRLIQPYQPNVTPRAVPFNVNGLAPQPIGPKPDSIRLEPQVADSSQLDAVMGELSESTWRVYKGSIHQTFPILASDRFRAQALIAQCPAHLREAFLEAFDAALKNTQGLLTETGGDSRTANRLLTEWETEGNRRSLQTDLVHLQTLILMAIETDSYGPSSIKGYHGGPTKDSFIGRALSLAYSMGLHLLKADPAPGDEFDPDMEDKIAMRAWWSLVMLDRWHAIGAALPARIPNDAVVVLPGLKNIMGEGPYTLLYLSSMLGNFVPMALSQPKHLGPSEERTISSWVNFAVDSFRMNFPPHLTPGTHPVLHLAYWHCRLLAYLFTPSALSTDLLWAAKESLNLLTQHPQLRSLLNHQFSSLTAWVLLELAKVDRTREEAIKVLKEMVETPFSPSAWDQSIRAKIAEKIRPVTSSGGIDSQNLQHLADLATATTELAAAITPAGNATATVTLNDNRPTTASAEDQQQQQQQQQQAQQQQQQEQQQQQHQPPPILYRVKENYEDLGFDPRPMLQIGYLNAFNSVEVAQNAV